MKTSEQIASEMISRALDAGFPSREQFEHYKNALFAGGHLNAPLGPIKIVERDGLHHLIDRNGRLVLVMGPETYEQLKKEALS